MPHNSIKQLQIMLADIALVTSEHGFIIAPNSMTNVEYLSDRNQLHGPKWKLLNGLGFAMDEYNMLWNSVDAQRLPCIYCKPVSVGGNFVVCGSGPSLDKRLLLKKLPSDWILLHAQVTIALYDRQGLMLIFYVCLNGSLLSMQTI